MKKNTMQKPTAKKEPLIITIANNKKAFHDYEVLEKYEAGIALFGTEIKSIRAGRVNLKEAYIIAQNGQAKILGMNISPYDFGNIFNHIPNRQRTLLLHKREIIKLEQRTAQEGLTIIPLSLYIKGSHAKLQIGLCKGKKLYDKRSAIQGRDTQREIQRTLKEHTR